MTLTPSPHLGEGNQNIALTPLPVWEWGRRRRG